MRGHESDSFEEFVQARYAALTRSAFVITAHRQDAEDLVQSALMKAVAVWGRIRDDPEPYVRRIMVNENISRWRRHRNREVVVESPPHHDRTAVPAASEDRMDLAAALAHLTPKQRTVLALRYYEDLTERATAELMGVAVGTVKSQTRDALAALRRVAPELTLQGAPEHVG